MKQRAFKNFMLFKPRTKYVCKKCRCSYKVFGDTWLEVKKDVKAIDGTVAHRIFWLCHSGHRTFRGYNKPVSWKKNLGGDKIMNSVEDTKSFHEEESEIEKEYAELLAHAKMKVGGGSGKRFL